MSTGSLHLKVVLDALDHASGPFKKIRGRSKRLSGALQEQHAGKA